MNTPQRIIRMRPDEGARHQAAEAGQAVAADLYADPGLAEWARATHQLVRIDRKPWRNPLHPPHDGTPAEAGTWYREHYLPHRPSLLRLLPALRGKVLTFASPFAGAHARALAEAANAAELGVSAQIRGGVPARTTAGEGGFLPQYAGAPARARWPAF